MLIRWSSACLGNPSFLLLTNVTTGQYYCIGKNLAMTELRSVIAMLVSKYDVAFAPGEDGTNAVRDMKDHFTATPGKLELVFKER